MTADDIRSRFAWLAYTENATRRMIAMIPDDRWNFVPAPGCRSIGQLVKHLYGGERATFVAFRDGSLTHEQYMEQEGPDITSQAEAQALVASAHALRNEVLAGLADEALARPIALFYGTFTGEQVIGFVYDEHWHHRGQMTVFLRTMGIEPPFIYDGGEGS